MAIYFMGHFVFCINVGLLPQQSPDGVCRLFVGPAHLFKKPVLAVEFEVFAIKSSDQMLFPRLYTRSVAKSFLFAFEQPTTILSLTS